jgi:4-amino-4-deoxy-L-arabinose transferase-like glycosyltransferase
MGMAVFVTGWMPLFYGSEVSPNLYVAAAAVGAAGSLLAYAAKNRRFDIVALGVFVAIAANIRMTDGLVLTAGLAIFAVSLMRLRRSIRVQVSIALGLLAGFVPWVIEAYDRFDGPLARLTRAREIVGGRPNWSLTEHLRLLDGPLIGPDRIVDISMAAIGALIFFTALVVIGTMDPHRGRAARLAAGLGVLLALPYLFYVSALAPRFLLPAMALGSVSSGGGILVLWRKQRIAGFAAAIMLAVIVAWSVNVATTIESEQYSQRAIGMTVATAISESVDGADCHFLSQYGFPQIVVATGCSGGRAIVDELGCQLRTVLQRRPGSDVYVALIHDVPLPLVPHLRAVENDTASARWTVYIVAGDADIPCSSGGQSD